MKSELQFILSACFIFSLWACSGGYELPSRPITIAIDPRDQSQLEEIMSLPVHDRFRRQIALLQMNGHELVWYPEFRGRVEHNEVVQIILFLGKTHMGFCTGTVVSDELISTAGHCNQITEELTKSGSICRGTVIFARRRSPKGAIEYSECGKVEFQSYYQDSLSGQLVDYALYRIAKKGSKLSLRPPFKKGLDLISGGSPSVIESKLANQAAVALAIDPPNHLSNLQSYYDIVLGRFVQPRTQFEALHIEMLDNRAQPGNSGSPIFLAPAGLLTGTEAVFDLNENMTFISTLTGVPRIQRFGNLLLATEPFLILHDYRLAILRP